MIRNRCLPFVFLLLLLVVIATPAIAQVPSYSPDDVPPAYDAWVVTYQGNLVRLGPNHQIAFVQTGPNEQKVWFSTDVALQFDSMHPNPSPGEAYYNRRFRYDLSSPWYWQYTFSQPVYGITGFVDTVLYSPLARYQDSMGRAWNYIMYSVNQPAACDGHQFGFATVQYSADGITWNGTSPLHHWGGPSAPCAPDLGASLVQVEALDAVDDGQGTIWLIGMEGDVGILSDRNNMNQTFASWGTSSYTNTSEVTLNAATSSVSSNGIFSPALPGTEAWRFTTYSYFFNMAMGWDALNGDLYWTRGYPYPFDRYPEYGQTVPSPDVTGDTEAYNSYWGVLQRVAGCAASPAIYPNRHQIYKMHIGSLSNFSQVHYGTWTLIADRGNYAGYKQSAALPAGPAQLISGQTAGSRDAGAASFLRDSSGNLVRTNGVGFVFGGSTLMETLSVGPCQLTGNERIQLESVMTTMDQPPTAAFTASCSARTCSFDGRGSSDDFGINSYAWSFGDGTSANGSVVSHRYATNGTFTVTLTVTDTAIPGQTGFTSHAVSPFDQPPTAAFTTSCSARTCSFDGRGSSDDFGINSYAWSFGDGTSTNGSVVSHGYATNGTFTVTLTVTDTAIPGQTGFTSHVVSPFDYPPTASFTVSCSGLYCAADASASSDDLGILSYNFNWGGSGRTGGTGSQSYITYSSAGTYTVTLIVGDTIGQDGSVTKVITVHGNGLSFQTVGFLNPGKPEFQLRLYHETGNGLPLKLKISGASGDDPVAGDWNGDGVHSIGQWNSSTATFNLRNTNSSGPADLTFTFGTPGAGWKPIAGDWNHDGIDTVGLYAPATGTFYLRNSNASGSADVTFTFTGAAPTWLPIAGDWNGDGTDTVGLYDPATSTFYLRNSNTSGGADLVFVFGAPGTGLLPEAGDWDGDGWDSIGVFNPATGLHQLRNLNNAGPADHQFVFWASGQDKPVAGDWDGI